MNEPGYSTDANCQPNLEHTRGHLGTRSGKVAVSQCSKPVEGLDHYTRIVSEPQVTTRYYSEGRYCRSATQSIVVCTLVGIVTVGNRTCKNWYTP